MDNHFYYCDIIPYFNPQSHQAAFSDKNYYDLLFSQFRTPSNIAKRIKGGYYLPTQERSHTPSTLESILTALRHYDRVLIKPTQMSETGLGAGL